MPSLNGHILSSSPPHTVFSTASKRKWDHLEDQSVPGDLTNSTHTHRRAESRDIDKVLRDVISVLERHDTSPSILNSPFDEVTRRESSQGNSVKRSKLSTPSKLTTVMTKFQNGMYNNLDDFKSDIICISDGLSASARSGNTLHQDDHSQHDLSASMKQVQLMMGIFAFKKLLGNIIHVEQQRKSLPHLTRNTLDGGEGEKTCSNSLSSSCKEETGEENSDKNLGRGVLTLFGTAGGHKQLFSSLQKLNAVHTSSNSSLLLSEIDDSAVRVPMPLHDQGLPLGISRTTVVPVKLDEALSQTKQSNKIIDHFAPSTSLMQLSPPKIPNYSMNKISSITWSHRDAKSEYGGTSGSSTENVTTGFWLGYSGKTPAQEPTSPEAKRKQRDRALSTGEAYPRLSEGAVAAHLQASEDAVFRSAYSTFAPNRDDSAAIVPVQLKNQIWWQKVGREKFESVCAMETLLIQDTPTYETWDDSMLCGQDEEEAFKTAVDRFDPDELDINFSLDPTPISRHNVTENLKEVSNLIETLKSYQRGRNSYLTLNSRGTFGQTNSLQDRLGGPASPSVDEIEAYRTLQARLFRIITEIPPYAVSKLQGQQTAELHLSHRLATKEKHYRGVMEEDQISRLTKAATYSAAAGSAAIARGTPASFSSQQTPGMQYNGRTTNVPPASRPNGYGQHTYPSQQSFARSGSSYSRNSLSNWQTPTPASSATQRPYGPPTYLQQTPKSSQVSYRPINGSGSYRAPGQLVNAQFQSQSSFLPQNHSPFQNRAQTAQTFSSAGPQHPHGSESPQKGSEQSSTMTTLPTVISMSNQHGMTEHDTQQHVIDRQRTQLTQKTYARTAAQNGFNPQNPIGMRGSQEPSSPHVNGIT